MEATKTQPDANPTSPEESKIAGTAERLSAVAHHKIERAADVVHPALDTLATNAHQVVDKVATMATHAAETAEAKSTDFHDLQSKFADDCRAFMQAHPLKALGYAAAAGFVLSRMLRL